MSVNLIAKAYTLKLPPAVKSVLVAMCDHANDAGGDCFPSPDLLAEKTGYTARHVQRQQAILETLKLIARVENARGGRGKKTYYQINLSAPIPDDLSQVKPLSRMPVKPEERVTSTTPFMLSSLSIKGDNTSPFSELEKGDIYDNNDQKGDIHAIKGDIYDAERVTSETEKGDIYDTAYKTDARRTVIEPPALTVNGKEIPPSLRSAPEGAPPAEGGADAVMDEIVAKGSTKKFVPPTEEEAIEFFLSIKATSVDAKKFFLHFESNGWKVSGRAKMVNWKASARGWMLRNPGFEATRSGTGTTAEEVVTGNDDKARQAFRIEQKRIIAEQNAAKEAADAAIDEEIAAMAPKLQESLRDAAKRRLKKLNPVVYTDAHLARTVGATAMKVRSTMREIYLEKKANVKPEQDQNGNGDTA